MENVSWNREILTVSQIFKFLFNRNAEVSDCGLYAIFNVVKDCRDNLVFFANLGKTGEIKGKLELTQVVHKFESDYDVSTVKNFKPPTSWIFFIFFST